MKYYFCVDIPWENTVITEYDTLKELKEDNEHYIKNNNDWYIIRGEIIDESEVKTQ